jgi:hypothetical protein
MHRLLLAGVAPLGAGLALVTMSIKRATAADLNSIKASSPASFTRVLQSRERGLSNDWADLLSGIQGFKASSVVRWYEAGLTVNGQPFDAQSAHKAAS